MRAVVRVGTRRSALAQVQSRLVVSWLERVAPAIAFELVGLETHGDRDRSVGGSPDFTGALETALRRREIDVAVHSTKDLPARDPADLVVAAFPRRADPSEAIVAGGWPLPARARVGSSSIRRHAQLLRWRPDLRVREIRGNVDTRLAAVRSGRFDAVVLARAGLERLGRVNRRTHSLPDSRFLPAPGQGALAVQKRRGDRALAFLARIDHRRSRAAVTAERALADALGASCNLPLGALATCRGGSLRLRAEVLSEDGRITVSATRRGTSARPTVVARAVARDLLRGGARTLLDRYR